MTRRPFHIFLAVCAAASLAFTSGCGASKSATSNASPSAIPWTTATTRASATPSASASASTAASQAAQTAQEDSAGAAVPWTTATSEPSQAQGHDALLLTDIKTGQHDGYDRVVLVFAGQGALGWWTFWGNATNPKGDAITVAGKNSLVVRGFGKETYALSAEEARTVYAGKKDITVGGQAIGSINYLAPWESEYQLTIGTYSDQYHIFTLTDPTRLVIDVKKP